MSSKVKSLWKSFGEHSVGSGIGWMVGLGTFELLGLILEKQARYAYDNFKILLVNFDENIELISKFEGLMRKSIPDIINKTKSRIDADLLNQKINQLL